VTACPLRGQLEAEGAEIVYIDPAILDQTLPDHLQHISSE